MFRGEAIKSETTCAKQLSIQIHKCGPRFPGPPAQDHGTLYNACYATLKFLDSKALPMTKLVSPNKQRER